MPTVILLDVSLSMCRKVLLTDTNEAATIRNLAVKGMHVLLDHIVSNSRLENTAFLIFSSLWDKVVNFTRDYEQIRAALNELDQYHDKTNILTCHYWSQRFGDGGVGILMSTGKRNSGHRRLLHHVGTGIRVHG